MRKWRGRGEIENVAYVGHSVSGLGRIFYSRARRILEFAKTRIPFPPVESESENSEREGRGDVLSSVVLSAPTSRFKYLNARWRGPWLDAALDRRK